MASAANMVYLIDDDDDDEDDDSDVKCSISSDDESHIPLHVVLSPAQQQPVHYTCDEFVTRLWQMAEKDFGYNTTDVEGGQLVRTGNHKTKSGGSQTTAMYGRIKPDALERIFQIMNLQRSDIFIDLGHGIGNATLQAAYTRGCESRGIEIMQQRCFIAEQFKERLAEIKHLLHDERDNDRRDVGAVTFLEGDFTLKCHKGFITADRTKIVKAFVNNAMGVFSHRSEIPGVPNLDEYCASLFANFCPGSIMVTVYPLFTLGKSLAEENQYRVNNLNLPSHIDASFFEYEHHSIGERAASWGDSEVCVHVYKRVEQSNEQGESRFICAYKNCNACLNGDATDALQHEWQSDEKISTLNNTCVFCNQKRLHTPRRRTPDSEITRASSNHSLEDDDDDGVCRKSKRKRKNGQYDGMK